jgi:NAD(P)-dependent dehydrogenase (short-subunit alcohol dehydrogenase family)
VRRACTTGAEGNVHAPPRHRRPRHRRRLRHRPRRRRALRRRGGRRRRRQPRPPRRRRDGPPVAAAGRALAVETDVAAAAAVAALLARAEAAYGRVDVLVNNAAAAADDVLAIDEAAWDRDLAVVLTSAFLCSKALLPGMVARRRGAIVNVASVNALSGLGEEAYSAGKAGMIGLTQNLAVKDGRHGVRANAVCPGTVRTPIWAARLARNPALFDRLAARYPLGRVDEPDDVANAVLFLASDEAARITGAVLPVDGGLLAGSFRMTRGLEAADVEE